MNAIMVSENNGQYQIEPNAEIEKWGDILDGAAKVTRIESLVGWGEWAAAYTIEVPWGTQWTKNKFARFWYFVAENGE